MRARRFGFMSVLLGLLLVAARSAEAGDEERRQGGKVVAREPRSPRLLHEFNVGVGILPLDALYTGVSLGGSYTLHLTDFFGLELVDFRYSANFDSGLENDLSERFVVSPTVSPEIEYIAGTGILFTPFFGKVAFLNEALTAVSTHLGVSFGLAHFTDGFRFQLSGGPGVRLIFSETVSSRLDVRGTFAFDELLSSESLLSINLSVAFNFGSRGVGDRAASGADEIDPDAVLDALFPGTEPQPQTEVSEEEEDS